MSNSYHHLHRSDDPAASIEGAKYASRKLGEMQEFALEAVVQYPDCTTNEMAEHYALRDNRMIGRRLNELEKLGRIHKGEDRPCRVTGKSAAVWHPGTRENCLQCKPGQISLL